MSDNLLDIVKKGAYRLDDLCAKYFSNRLICSNMDMRHYLFVNLSSSVEET
jgi:hypothetical protein